MSDSKEQRSGELLIFEARARGERADLIRIAAGSMLNACLGKVLFGDTAPQMDEPQAEGEQTLAGKLFRPLPEVPFLRWTSYKFGPTHPLPTAGSLGDYYADVHPLVGSESPAETFNIGFYAGVLAAKVGIVDPEKFKAPLSPEQLSSPDQQDNS